MSDKEGTSFDANQRPPLPIRRSRSTPTSRRQNIVCGFTDLFGRNELDLDVPAEAMNRHDSPVQSSRVIALQQAQYRNWYNDNDQDAFHPDFQEGKPRARSLPVENTKAWGAVEIAEDLLRGSPAVLMQPGESLKQSRTRSLPQENSKHWYGGNVEELFLSSGIEPARHQQVLLQNVIEAQHRALQDRLEKDKDDRLSEKSRNSGVFNFDHPRNPTGTLTAAANTREKRHPETPENLETGCCWNNLSTWAEGSHTAMIQSSLSRESPGATPSSSAEPSPRTQASKNMVAMICSSSFSRSPSPEKTEEELQASVEARLAARSRLSQLFQQNATVTPMPDNMEQRQKRSNIHLRIALIVLLLVLLVVTITLAVIFGPRKSRSASPTPAENAPSGEPASTPESVVTLPPSIAPSEPPTINRFDAFRERLAYLSDDAFQSTTTSQYLALEWMVNDDPAELSAYDTPLTILTERYIVALLYFSTSGSSHWTNQLNFLSSFSVCRWNDFTMGVSCENGSVTKINLDNNGLQGTIPDELMELSSLKELFLGSNIGLSGNIPSGIGKMLNMERLWLDRASLTGPIPSEMGLLTELEWLWLSRNQMTGAIPTQIGEMSALSTLYLDGNKFNGSVPTELGRLTKLATLSLRENEIEGNIPSELSALSELTVLYLYNNTMTGTVPLALSALTNLVYVWLHDNAFSGDLSPVFCGQQQSYAGFRSDCREPNPKVDCDCCTHCCDSTGCIGN